MDIPFTDPVLIFASAMVLILLAPLLAARVRLPEIIGLILAGLLVGPHGAGILARDTTIILLGNVGLLFIMFIAGLEIDLNQVRRNKGHTLFFGLITFTIPFVLGVGLGITVFSMSVPVAILLASMFSSHTLVTYPIIGKLGLTKNRAVTATIGGTILTDTLALLVLAVIAGMARGQVLNVAFWVREFLFVGLYIAGIIYLLPIIGRWFFRSVNADENTEFFFVIALTFLCAWLAHPAGLEPIIGAFLAGLIFNTLIPENSLLMSRILFAGNAIFVPFFLLSVGMLVNIKMLYSSTWALVISLGMIVVALTSKLAAAYLTQLFLRYRKDEGMLIFGLSVNQAAATLAAVLIGYDLGLFSEEIITGTILMIAVTCLVGSIVTQKAGRKVALYQEQAEFNPSTIPHRILIPLKDKAGAKKQLDVAFLLREKDSRESIYPLQVVHETRNSEEQIAAAEKILAHTVVRSLAAGVPVTPVTRVDINLMNGMVSTIRDYRISMVVMEWDGRPGSRTRTFGRNIDAIVEHSRQMILMNRIVTPVNTTRRIVLVLPPLAEYEIGFDDCVKTTKVLAHQAGTSILVMCCNTTYKTLNESLDTIKPSVPITFKRYDYWKMILPELDESVIPDDWLIVINVRKGKIAWQPYSTRLPALLAARFSSNSLSIIVAPTERMISEELSEDTKNIFSVFRPEHIVLYIDTASTEEVIRKILEHLFGTSNPALNRIAKALRGLSLDQPVELVEHTILLHMNIEEVNETVALLGVSRYPLDIPFASSESRIIVVLLDPVGQAPALHLQKLSEIASFIIQPGIVERLLNAHSIEQL